MKSTPSQIRLGSGLTPLDANSRNGPIEKRAIATTTLHLVVQRGPQLVDALVRRHVDFMVLARGVDLAAVGTRHLGAYQRHCASVLRYTRGYVDLGVYGRFECRQCVRANRFSEGDVLKVCGPRVTYLLARPERTRH